MSTSVSAEGTYVHERVRLADTLPDIAGYVTQRVRVADILSGIGAALERTEHRTPPRPARWVQRGADGQLRVAEAFPDPSPVGRFRP